MAERFENEIFVLKVGKWHWASIRPLLLLFWKLKLTGGSTQNTWIDFDWHDQVERATNLKAKDINQPRERDRGTFNLFIFWKYINLMLVIITSKKWRVETPTF